MKRMNQLQILLYVLHILNFIPLWTLWKKLEGCRGGKDDVYRREKGGKKRQSGWVECRQADFQKSLMLYGRGMNPL